MSVTIATCNVNGVRAAYRKGMGEWLAETEAEVVALQEVRAPDEILRELVDDQWHLVSQASQLKGRAGVAILSRHPLEQVRYGLVEEEPDVDTGRWIEATVELGGTPVTVVSAYLHSGVVGTEKMDFKYAHLARVSQRLQKLREESHVVMVGDFNIVHTERDIKNWKGNHNKTAGVLDEEIAYLDEWFGAGWVDVQRQLAGAEAQGPYTWWSQRGKAFDNDAGWRIDYQMATPQLAGVAGEFRVDRAESYDSRWSDHAPLLVSYDL
ncbi:exodeoxyribonuclease III [Boudabousia marimammalium]|uniref:Exodeoxyribonuclease III n=1 Tax=Boudabousia marimammalium TaxID=156892 RepID=A0A1Q5PSF8_9ACTO|nr:exodeoxyribonuclease III [Boudabousia marimammalium]OKL50340.1 exodeoxyribonuclease III [Boudabousia marimammalium]